MGDSSIAEQTPSSHRNTSVNTNADSSFKTPICVLGLKIERKCAERLCSHAPKNACH